MSRVRDDTEARKYTTAMWQSFTAQMVGLCHYSEPKRRAFRDGFNGEPKVHHHAVQDAFALGRHAALLLGYKP